MLDEEHEKAAMGSGDRRSVRKTRADKDGDAGNFRLWRGYRLQQVKGRPGETLPTSPTSESLVPYSCYNLATRKPLET